MEHNDFSIMREETNLNDDFNLQDDFDFTRTPQKDVSFVDGLKEIEGDIEFTPTPKKNGGMTSVIFPSPIRQEPTYGNLYSDPQENDENCNPEIFIKENQSDNHLNSGLSDSAKIAVSLLKNTIKDPGNMIDFNQLSSNVTYFILCIDGEKRHH